MKVICDIETESLTPHIIHCIVAKELDTGELYKFIPDEVHYAIHVCRPLSAFKSWAKGVTEWWGHNFLSFDAPVLNRILGTNIKVSQIMDTLILSQMLYTEYQGRHGLAAWGQRLGLAKIEFDAYEEYTEEMLEYCVRDVELNSLVCDKMEERIPDSSDKAIRLEHEFNYVINVQMKNGFKLDQEKAHKLYVHILDEADIIEAKVKEFFKPEEIVFIPKVNRPDLGYTKGVPFIKYKEFNLGSPKQKVQRLAPYWKPYVRTDGYKKNQRKLRAGLITQEEFDKKTEFSWKVCDENLDTLADDAPEGAKNLALWQTLTHRHKSIEAWLDASMEDGRVHGRIISVGAPTHRCAHSGPNMTTIPALIDRTGKTQVYGKECRELWIVDAGNVLLGTDASGIQLRMLAHYIGDEDYIAEAIEGDVHERHSEALGAVCSSRNTAKTFIYAWLLGAAAGKVAEILNTTIVKAKGAMKSFVQNIPGLADLLIRKTQAAQRGYMIGIDGRRIDLQSDHKALSAYLQGGESTVMKQANVLWYWEAVRRDIKFKQCAFSHDEWQTEVGEADAEELGQIQVDAIIQAGIVLGVKCPLDAEYKTGSSWAETH